MTLKEYIKKNKLFSTITISFLVWITFLYIMAIFSIKVVKFYDYFADDGYSSGYSSQIPLLRYFIEPIVGIVLYLTIRGYYFPIAILLLYIIIRILYLIFKSKKIIKSLKLNLFAEMLRDFLGFTVKVALIIIAWLLSYYIIGSLIYGVFIKYGFATILEITFLIGLILLGIKFVSLIMIFVHPHLKFNFTEKHENIRELHKFLKGSKREITYFLSFVFLFITANILALTTRVPTYYIETDKEKDEILIDFHAHTTFSDGWLTPEERIMWYIDHGIDVAVITDHQTASGALKARRFVKENDLDFTVIIGQEYTTEYGIHLNIYGIEDDIIPIEFEEYENELESPYAMTVEDMIEYVKDEGAYVIVNHYYYEEDDLDDKPYTLKELRDRGVDGFEIINHGNKLSKEIRDFCIDNDLICISASDVHVNPELMAFMKIELEDPDDLSVDSIFESLKENDYEAILVEINPDRIEFQGFFANFVEIEGFLNYLFNLDRYQYLSWILWSVGIYIFIALMHRKIKEADIEQLKSKIL